MLPTSLALIAKGVLLGLGAAVPIGPVNVEIARRTLRQGYRHGVAIGGGASTVDVVYAIVASVGFAPLIGAGWVTYGLGTAGILLLLYLAALCFRGVWQTVRAKSDAASPFNGESIEPVGSKVHTSYITGLLMTLLNPMTLAFWFVVLPALASRLTDNPRHDLPWLCAGVFIGAFGWCLGFAGVLSILGRFRRSMWALIADAVGGVVLLGFAIVAAVKLLAGS